jgi:hypothetical protein
MQLVLGIDLSSQPCELTLSQVEGTQVEVVERVTTRLDLFSQPELLKIPELVISTAKSRSLAVGAEPTQGVLNSNDGTGSIYQHADTVAQAVNGLAEAISKLSSGWTATSVILPQNDFLSLNIDLPFADPRNLDRIVDLEVQDVVPFELESFFVQYAAVGASADGMSSQKAAGGGQFDVHIGILPRVVVKNVLDLCKEAGLEPNVLTVPSSAIAAVYHLAKDYLSPNSAVVFNRGDEYCIAVYINGEARVERSVYASQILSAISADKRHENLQHIFTALKLILASAERRYGTKVEKVYLLGREVKGSNTHQLFGRPLEGLPLNDIVKSSDGQVGISALSAVFAQDEAKKNPLSNFRTREFSFTPRIAEFFRALLGTKKAVTRAALATCLAAAGIFGFREYMISSYENQLISRIRKVIPTFADEPSKVRENLMQSVNKLSEELGAFGSRARVTPADAFIEVVKGIPTSGEIAVTSIRVSGVRVQISANAAELSPVERFVKALDTRKDIFSKVDYKTSRSGNRFNVSVDITLAS